MPIDKDVLERVSKDCRALRIEWACIVARQYEHVVRTLIACLAFGANHYETIEELRADEAQLVERVRHAARHANFALDQLDAQGTEYVLSLLPAMRVGQHVETAPREFVVPVKPRARGL